MVSWSGGQKCVDRCGSKAGQSRWQTEFVWVAIGQQLANCSTPFRPHFNSHIATPTVFLVPDKSGLLLFPYSITSRLIFISISTNFNRSFYYLTHKLRAMWLKTQMSFPFDTEIQPLCPLGDMWDARLAPPLVCVAREEIKNGITRMPAIPLNSVLNPEWPDFSRNRKERMRLEIPDNDNREGKRKHHLE